MSTTVSSSNKGTARKAPAERAADILDSACKLAVEQGLSSLTLRSVAARAGVTSTLVAHYSDGVDGLIAEVFTRIVSREIEEVRAAAAGGRTPTQRLRTLCEELLDGTRDNTTLVWVEALAMGYRNERLATSVRASLDDWQQLFSSVIADGVSCGEFAVHSPAAAAWQIQGLIDGVNEQALVLQQAPASRGDLIYGAAERILGLQPGSLDLNPDPTVVAGRTE
ncbi:TetR family transcriptional regulator C-terminal domain-containing protein [Arthrobacter sp.]|uniref:TetR/AcrR family transcriptional regulator n=1 Tax=Arthrobacter sp. TaxID=1667 RepID=UPI00289AA601|nr:TetR family transcriptional regulator C-terminal domain-containing protein [Arthrobacter sp.]